MKYDYGVVIGRFQPFHVGHERVLKFAKQHCKNLVVLIGSSEQYRSPKNPFTFQERMQMISKTEDSGPGYIYRPIHDHHYNDDAWVTEVRDTVNDRCTGKIALIGFRKDSSSYYQGLFPEWDYVEVPSQYGTFNATDIRNQYLQESPIISEFLHPDIRAWLKDFAFGDEFKYLVNEQKYLIQYEKDWGKGPFVTVDAVCVQSGHILLVTRGDCPFKGALALPGGFLNPKERIRNAVVRELKEETRIEDHRGEMPPSKLQSFITKEKVFDAPDRSARGRIITHAFKFEFPNQAGGLYKVRGDDDAAHAQWYPFSELRPADFMEDHMAIIQEMTGVQIA